MFANDEIILVDDDEPRQTIENQIDSYEVVQVDALVGAESLKSGELEQGSFEPNQTKANDQCDIVQAQNASLDYFKVDALSHGTNANNTNSDENPSDIVQALFLNQAITTQAVNNLMKIDEKIINCEKTIKKDEEKTIQLDGIFQSDTENLQQLSELFDELIELSKELDSKQNHDLDEDDDAEFNKAFLQLDSNMDFVSNDYNQWIDELSKSKENVLLQSQHLNDHEQQQQHLKLFRNENYNNMLQKFESEISTNVLINNFNDPMMMMIVPNDVSI